MAGFKLKLYFKFTIIFFTATSCLPLYAQTVSKDIYFDKLRGKDNAYELVVSKVDTLGIAKNFNLNETPAKQLSFNQGKSDANTKLGIFLTLIGAGMMYAGWATEGQDGYPSRIFGSIWFTFGLGRTYHEIKKPDPPYYITRTDQGGSTTHKITIQNIKKDEAKILDNMLFEYFSQSIDEENTRLMFEYTFNTNFEMYIDKIKATKEYKKELLCIQGKDASVLLDVLDVDRSVITDDKQSLQNRPLNPLGKSMSILSLYDAAFKYQFFMQSFFNNSALDVELPDSIIDNINTQIIASETKKDDGKNNDTENSFTISEISNIPGMKCIIFSEVEGDRIKEACYFYPDLENPYQYRDLYLLLKDIEPEKSQVDSKKWKHIKSVGSLKITEVISRNSESDEIPIGYSLNLQPSSANCCPDTDKEQDLE